jgi:DNA-binding NarL/FixJ family response regulator
MGTIRVILADDHAVVRVGVRSLLEEMPEIKVVAEAADGHQALALIEALRPDILVTDIAMPGMNGLELAELVAREYAETRVLVLSMHKEKAFATKALACGAAGYLLKEAATGELGAAVLAVSRGEAYLSPAVSAYLVADYARLARAEVPQTDPLSPRQREVLRLVAEGLATKAIAKRLGISVKTAETHRAQMMERLSIHDVAGLVRYAIRTGMVDASE